jgi:glycine dehydrogenase subunit 1
LAEALDGVGGAKLVTPRFFNEFALKLPKKADTVVNALAAKGVLGGVAYSRLNPQGPDDLLLVCATETNTEADIAAYKAALKEVL